MYMYKDTEMVISRQQHGQIRVLTKSEAKFIQ